VGATVHADILPRSAIRAGQAVALQHECLVAGGDDYELLFTAAPAQRDAVLAAGRAAGVAVTRCGTIDAQPGLRVVDARGQPLARSFQGYDHFA
jgi:thiamine-monophosphate kinase